MLLSKEKIYKGAVTKSFFVKHILYFIINGSHGTLHEVINIRLLLMVKETSLEILLMIVKCIILDVNLR